MADIFILR